MLCLKEGNRVLLVPVIVCRGLGRRFTYWVCVSYQRGRRKLSLRLQRRQLQQRKRSSNTINQEQKKKIATNTQSEGLTTDDSSASTHPLVTPGEDDDDDDDSSCVVVTEVRRGGNRVYIQHKPSPGSPTEGSSTSSSSRYTRVQIHNINNNKRDNSHRQDSPKSKFTHPGPTTMNRKARGDDVVMGVCVCGGLLTPAVPPTTPPIPIPTTPPPPIPTTPPPHSCRVFPTHTTTTITNNSTTTTCFRNTGRAGTLHHHHTATTTTTGRAQTTLLQQQRRRRPPMPPDRRELDTHDPKETLHSTLSNPPRSPLPHRPPMPPNQQQLGTRDPKETLHSTLSLHAPQSLSPHTPQSLAPHTPLSLSPHTPRSLTPHTPRCSSPHRPPMPPNRQQLDTRDPKEALHSSFSNSSRPPSPCRPPVLPNQRQLGTRDPKEVLHSSFSDLGRSPSPHRPPMPPSQRKQDTCEPKTLHSSFSTLPSNAPRSLSPHRPPPRSLSSYRPPMSPSQRQLDTREPKEALHSSLSALSSNSHRSPSPHRPPLPPGKRHPGKCNRRDALHSSFPNLSRSPSPDGPQRERLPSPQRASPVPHVSHLLPRSRPSQPDKRLQLHSGDLHSQNHHQQQQQQGRHHTPAVEDAPIWQPKRQWQHRIRQERTESQQCQRSSSTESLDDDRVQEMNWDRRTAAEEEKVNPGSLLHALRPQPYFHNISRIKSNSILETAEEGVFLVRPSTRSANPLTLSLQHQGRVYNINIRQRHDGLFALGSGTPTELAFNSVDDLVTFFRQRSIKLQNGEFARLVNSPPKICDFECLTAS